MWMSVLKTTEDAASLPLASTYLTASIALATQDMLVMVLLAQVSHSLYICRNQEPGQWWWFWEPVGDQCKDVGRPCL